MATISIRNGNTGAVTAASGPLDVVTAINSGADILVNGQTAILSNMGGNWFVNGQPIATWFQPPSLLPAVPGSMPLPPATGPTVAPVDQPVDPSRGGPILSPLPIIRTEPFPVTAAGSVNLTPGTLLLLAGAAYFLFFRRSS